MVQEIHIYKKYIWCWFLYFMIIYRVTKGILLQDIGDLTKTHSVIVFPNFTDFAFPL